MAKKQEDQYIETSYVSPDGNYITVLRPILTPEERERRENRIKAAMCKFYEERIKAGATFPPPSDDEENSNEL